MGKDRHALVVGGTGMLREVVLSLAKAGPVSVVARGERRLASLAEASRRIVPVRADYGRPAEWEAALREAARARGRFTLAVAWVHSSAPGAAETAAGFVTGPFFHVLGSAAADPSRPDPGRRARFAAVPGISYHEVVLGFVREGSRSRWLTDGEIARGVLEAVAARAPRRIVGVVEPWSAKP
jgi:NAD(P)-dependent dehydrogenase (short-subunit alcohol dehydrogenase family)